MRNKLMICISESEFTATFFLSLSTKATPFNSSLDIFLSLYALNLVADSLFDLTDVPRKFSSPVSTRDKFEDIKVEMTTIRERLDTLTPAGQENNGEGRYKF